eukprot:TRINITY_DN529_c0_g1_i12.p1 TRINITY_DN529_c0_g1~~TRINITY_DN529_c0_g1_i12.p1  ORF type:complete len:521 (+),score=146.89 TRINITY_DN529_c0_g1_i12:137-1564(+)
MLRSLVGSEMCIRDRYQRRVREESGALMALFGHGTTRTPRGWGPAVFMALLIVSACAIDDFDDALTLDEFENDTFQPERERLGEASLEPTDDSYTVVDADQRLPGIETNALKSQKTMKLVLKNGMGVNIIHNPDLEASSMAVSMEVGSWSDPDDALGMAHFVEHMLFMGTKQHPKPGNFDDFLSANGAQISNAMTGSQSTTYAFSAPHAAFTEGVSRFSEFFTDPLFDSAGAQKEMHAVNQEFEMHKDQDLYRLYHVEKELANPHHPNHRFTIGNLDTLGNVTNAKLTAWYGSHYSSNLMHVAVYTAEPLDKVVELIVDKFSKVKNQNYQRQNVGAAPTMDPKLAGHVIHVKPLTAVRSVSLKWELPTEFASMTDTQPGRIVGTLLGDEGPNSLLAYLREEQLATGLQAGFETSGRDNAPVSYTHLRAHETPEHLVCRLLLEKKKKKKKKIRKHIKTTNNHNQKEQNTAKNTNKR